MVDLSEDVNYPIIAIGDLHGQRLELERLIGKLEELPEWPDCALVFLGDFVDRGAQRPVDDRPRAGIAPAPGRRISDPRQSRSGPGPCRPAGWWAALALLDRALPERL
jgi:serine/threonine protein phosphatase 1